MHVYAYTNYQLLDVRFVTRNFSYTPFYGIRAQMTRHDNTDETPFAGFYFPVLFLIVLIQIFKMRFTRQDFENFFWQWTDGNLYPPHIRCATFSLHRMIAPPPPSLPTRLSVYILHMFQKVTALFTDRAPVFLLHPPLPLLRLHLALNYFLSIPGGAWDILWRCIVMRFIGPTIYIFFYLDTDKIF